MIILYTKNNCKDCDYVKNTFEERRLSYEEKNIDESEEFMSELKEFSVLETPFMFDPQANFKTGDIEDMIDYASEYAF